MLDRLVEWDRNLFVFLNNLGIEKYDQFWIYITQIESWIPFFVLLIVLLLLFLKLKKGIIAVVMTIITFGITFGITHITKSFIARIRPNNDATFSELIRVLQTPHDYSFFSGHASSSFAIITFIVLLLQKQNKAVYLLYLWPLLFVLSRIYVGVHYPSDLLIGALVGTILAVLMYKLVWKNLPIS